MDQSPSTNPRPALWNPAAAAGWSLMFSPMFGAFLHARNARALGRHAEATLNLIWFFIYLVFVGVTLGCMLVPSAPDLVFNVAALFLLLGWYSSVGRAQIGFVKETYGRDYPRKSWAIPLLIGFGALVVLMIAFVALALVAEALSTDPARA